MSSGSTRRTARATSRTARAGGGPKGGGSMAGVLAAIILIGAFALFGLLWLKGENDKKIAEQNRKVPVVVAATELPQGHQITSADLTIGQIHHTAVPQGSFSDPNDPQLVGKVVSIPVAAGLPILQSYLGEFKKEEVVVEQKLMPEPGESVVALVLKGQDAMQPFIEKGRIVSIFRSFTTAGGNKIVKSLSGHARILEVQKNDSTLENAQNGGSQVVVNLALSPEDAQSVNTYRDEAVLVDGENQEPPPSNIALLTYWKGIESEDMEITEGTGESKINKEVAKN